MTQGAEVPLSNTKALLLLKVILFTSTGPPAPVMTLELKCHRTGDHLSRLLIKAADV